MEENANKSNYSLLEFEKADPIARIRFMSNMYTMMNFGIYSPLLRHYWDYEKLEQSPILYSSDKKVVKEFYHILINEYAYTDEDLINWTNFIVDKNGLKISDKLFNTKDTKDYLTTNRLVQILDKIEDLFVSIHTIEVDIFNEKDEVLLDEARKKPNVGNWIYIKLYGNS